MEKVTITLKGSWFVVAAPFRSSALHDWRQVFGRKYDNETKTNLVPVKYKKSLEAILRDNYSDCEISWP